MKIKKMGRMIGIPLGIAVILLIAILRIILGAEASNEDNAILALVLHRHYAWGGFTVVVSETQHFPINPKSSLNEESWENKGYIKSKIKIENYDIGPLVDKFFQKNQKSVRLSLKSSKRDGYVIDYAGRYEKYFNEGGGGWEKWYKDNPRAHGSTQVSLPIWDKERNIILVYIGTQEDWLAGAGYVIAYKYENAKLKEISRVMLWIS